MTDGSLEKSLDHFAAKNTQIMDMLRIFPPQLNEHIRRFCKGWHRAGQITMDGTTRSPDLSWHAQLLFCTEGMDHFLNRRVYMPIAYKLFGEEGSVDPFRGVWWLDDWRSWRVLFPTLPETLHTHITLPFLESITEYVSDATQQISHRMEEAIHTSGEASVFLFEQARWWRENCRNEQTARSQYENRLQSIKSRLPKIVAQIAASKSFAKSKLLAATRQEVEQILASM